MTVSAVDLKTIFQLANNAGERPYGSVLPWPIALMMSFVSCFTV
jgi:hypothetical protein